VTIAYLVPCSSSLLIYQNSHSISMVLEPENWLVIECWNKLSIICIGDNLECLLVVYYSIVVSNMPTGGFTDVGREYTNAIDFCLIFHRCIMEKRNHFYFVLLQENPFFYCL
jgi:hypothetical protein